VYVGVVSKGGKREGERERGREREREREREGEREGGREGEREKERGDGEEEERFGGRWESFVFLHACPILIPSSLPSFHAETHKPPC
jgi:hypothetical protein